MTRRLLAACFLAATLTFAVTEIADKTHEVVPELADHEADREANLRGDTLLGEEEEYPIRRELRGASLRGDTLAEEDWGPGKIDGRRRRTDLDRSTAAQVEERGRKRMAAGRRRAPLDTHRGHVVRNGRWVGWN
eukprot:TRINITY_DN120_c0_g1_i4.p2 TRINITY_DN120_c0_g1~~TRINITY_DN120_c0_g1_i4.p2  ORF type:complete len:134 (-),score=12.71 TRINITY_DN120_c0_g1_i4:181-582(-)